MVHIKFSALTTRPRVSSLHLLLIDFNFNFFSPSDGFRMEGRLQQRVGLFARGNEVLGRPQSKPIFVRRKVFGLLGQILIEGDEACFSTIVTND